MNIRAAALMAADGPRRDNFNSPLRVDGDRSRIASVVLLCSDHNTCSLTSGDRDVKLAFSRRGSGRRRTARRRAAPAGASSTGHLHAVRGGRQRCAESRTEGHTGPIGRFAAGN
jgi:hypothetical protein